jgi:cold shock protein
VVNWQTAHHGLPIRCSRFSLDGFIQPQAGGKDVFVHISAVERAGLSTLIEGQHIEYEIEENRGKTSAVNLKVK